jgi:hypothetical protein
MKEIKSNIVTITTAVLYSDILTARQKLLIAVISNLSGGDSYCTSSNRYLAKVMGSDSRTIQRDLNRLESLNFISRKVCVNEDKSFNYRYLKLTDLGNETPIRKLSYIKREPKFGFVYIMHDTKNGFYKVGISSNPEYRESTLQSEKPSIELVWKSKYILKNAKKIESKIHEHFNLNRVRGEWFELNLQDIETIKEFCELWTN